MYGPNGSCGKRARLCIIEGIYASLCDRVGVQHNATEDLCCSLLPLRVQTIYEVTWKSEYVHDADFDLVYDNYDFV